MLSIFDLDGMFYTHRHFLHREKITAWIPRGLGVGKIGIGPKVCVGCHNKVNDRAWGDILRDPSVENGLGEYRRVIVDIVDTNGDLRKERQANG